jgi:mRNA interferase RelE/StbE
MNTAFYKQAITDIPKGDIKKLQGHERLYRLRVGDWRIVFSYLDNETVLIEKNPRAEKFIGGCNCDRYD